MQDLNELNNGLKRSNSRGGGGSQNEGGAGGSTAIKLKARI
jgi:hypothetical protein